MSRTSRDKGKRGELLVARIMSAWWCGNPALLKASAFDLPIRRTPLSGGWASAKGVGGDLVSVKEETNDFNLFSVEVKNQECWSFDGMIKDRAWPIYRWWEQCTEAAEKSESIPMLIFTKNRHPLYLCLGTHEITMLFNQTSKVLPTVRWQGFSFGLLEKFVAMYSKREILRTFDYVKEKHS